MTRGRPPITKACGRCHQLKPRRGFSSASADVCTACRREIRANGGPAGVQMADLAFTGFSGAPTDPYLPMERKIKEPITDAIGFDVVQTAIAKAPLLNPLARCQCCWETRHVGLDAYGGTATVCARCNYQVCAVGCCHLHHGPVLYPELAEGKAAVPVVSPPEVEALFIVPESTTPKYDTAELADADV
jgi:hypothetical protein